jgi:hypothetical protein
MKTCLYIYLLVFIGNGYLDLVVGTLNGQVHLLETTVPYHPVRDIDIHISLYLSFLHSCTHSLQ